MTWRKRIFDLFFASLLVIILGPVILWLVCYILIKQGRPLFYVAERMKTPTQPFGLWKFRTMSVVDKDAGVSGGDKQARITPLGAKLRAKRLDEFPQLWNILKGDLSFVGPRRCTTPEATDDIYTRICVPRKARLDLIYQRNQSTCYDFDLVFQPIGNLFRRRSSAAKPRRC